MREKDAHRGTGHGSRVAHDDALRDTRDAVRLAERRRVEQVVRRLLERREHEHAVLHLRDTKARDAEDLSLYIMFMFIGSDQTQSSVCLRCRHL